MKNPKRTKKQLKLIAELKKECAENPLRFDAPPDFSGIDGDLERLKADLKRLEAIDAKKATLLKRIIRFLIG